MQWLLATIGGLLPIIGIVGLFFFLRQRKAQEYDIPPLDLVDAKKLDDMVSKQVEEVLRPMLQTEGYTEEQIKEILTRTSLGGRTFRR
ncbi:hypothetical protein [Oscillatoria salina]|uniref:hypothetical protein n=1 Tax=Oscillatoria salina TaxID=331517 RepID=UPI0013BC1AE1|nr:hypothetical protein [Oscillatoria salina]MBZ8180735.1 hypothetical protein [Oscillatoria salina IIICB1]NET91072.1 hypothetical protein [Kamptonema sp. SIO1D9]